MRRPLNRFPSTAAPARLGGLSLLTITLVVAFSPWIAPQAKAQGTATEAKATEAKAAEVKTHVKPSAIHKQIARLVSNLLQREHVSKRPLDDEASSRCLTKFVEKLDPTKIYFTQTDIDGFKQWDDDLDDLISKGDISVAYSIFETYSKRVDERVALVDELLKEKPDFQKDETIAADHDALAYPKTDDEIRERWRKQIKYEWLLQRTNDVEEKDVIERLHKRYHDIATRTKQIDSDELLERFVTAMTTGFDPHSTYMSPGSHEDFRIVMRLKLDGIGARMKQEGSHATIVEVVAGGAASKEGSLQANDRVVAVGQGDDGEMVDAVHMNLKEIIRLIRGERGSKVRLQVISEGSTEKKIITITRARVELKKSAASGKVITAGTKADGTPNKIGVLNLPSFYLDMDAKSRGDKNYRSMTRDCRKILADFNAQGVDAVMVDLRRNGGGSLSEAIEFTGLFIDQGPVVQVRSSSGRVSSHSDTDRGMLWQGPLVVMVSKYSASASEIFAGAIKDYNRGLVVGDAETHGKGTVQNMVDLGRRLFRAIPQPPKLGALKVTTAQFYRPDGASTQNRGVKSHVTLPSLSSHRATGESELDFALKFDEVAAAPHEKMGMITPAVVRELVLRSSKRVKASEGFGEIALAIQRYTERKNRKVLTLNEKKFLAERETGSDETKAKQPGLGDATVSAAKRNFYVQETLDITVDYIEALRKLKVAAKS